MQQQKKGAMRKPLPLGASVDTAKLTVPNAVDGEETVTVVLEGYSRTLTYDEFYTLSCTAREVFEP